MIFLALYGICSVVAGLYVWGQTSPPMALGTVVMAALWPLLVVVLLIELAVGV